jgi:hypothetical protein
MESEKKFSERSQHSCIVERDLRRERGKCEGTIGYIQVKVDEAERSREAQTRHALAERGYSSSSLVLRNVLIELEGHNRELGHFKDHRETLDSQIAESMKPDPTRNEKQSRLSALVVQRLAKDRQAETALNGLRKLLAERTELTAEITAAAASLDFTVNGPDGLDAKRITDLSASLPKEIAETSEQWAGWFFGENEGAKPYVVRVGDIVIPETLDHSGVYYFGETVMLTDEQARELLRSDRPWSEIGNQKWDLLPPSVMTPETFQETLAAAEKQGISVPEFHAQQDAARRLDAKHAHYGHVRAMIESGEVEVGVEEE